MDEIAERIVEHARAMPLDTGVGLVCNGVSIVKVRVVGGVGIEVRADGTKLLYPLAFVGDAARCFLTAAHNAPGAEHSAKYNPLLRHSNGIAIHGFEWNDKKERDKAVSIVKNTLIYPPLCEQTPLGDAETRMDARGLEGWSASEKGHETEGEEEGEEEE